MDQSKPVKTPSETGASENLIGGGGVGGPNPEDSWKKSIFTALLSPITILCGFIL